MINSPSISLVSVAQPSEKSSSAQTAKPSGEKFGSVFDNTQKDSTNATLNPAHTDNQKIIESEANQEDRVVTKGDSSLEDESGLQNSTTDQESAKVEETSDAAETGDVDDSLVDNNSESSEKLDTVDTVEATNSDVEGSPEEDKTVSEDGNVLHDDGQNIAADNVLAGASAQDVKRDESGLEDEAATEKVNIDIVKDGSETSLANSDPALTEIEPEKKELSGEKAAQVSSEVPISVNSKVAQASDQSETEVKPTVASKDELVGVVGTKATMPEATISSASKIPSAMSVDEAGQHASNPLSDKAVDPTNLKWVLDQLNGTKSERPMFAGSTGSVPDQVGLSTDLKLTDAANMSELMDSGDIDLSGSFEEIMSAKKPLDQLMANITAQSQSLGSQGLTGSVATLSSFSPARGDVPAQLTMHSPPTSPHWAEEMNQKVSWVVREGIKTAHIQLDPPELGSLAVKVTVDQDSNTHVSFVASSAQAKEALEGQMQRLREMLQQQGLDLDAVDVEVSQRNDQSGQSGSFGDKAGDGSESEGMASLEGDIDDELENVSYIAPAAQGIDYYA